MKPNATTADPLAAATAIARAARYAADEDYRSGAGAVVALAAGVLLSLAALAAMVVSPAAIPMWCAAHGGCP